jgi:hypothetical protein
MRSTGLSKSEGAHDKLATPLAAGQAGRKCARILTLKPKSQSLKAVVWVESVVVRERP